jgi:hypothetical protein
LTEQDYKTNIKNLIKGGIEDHKEMKEYVSLEPIFHVWDNLFTHKPELRKKYWEAMVSLQSRFVPNYITTDNLYYNLWALFKEVVVNNDKYQEESALNSKVEEFCRTINRPLIGFRVIYEIKNFEIGDKHFVLGNVEIFKLTSEYLKNLLYFNRKASPPRKFTAKWDGKSIATVLVQATDLERAHDVGLDSVNRVLNIVRLVAVKEKIWRFLDELFLWEIGDSLAIPQTTITKETSFMVRHSLGRRPLILDMSTIITENLSKENFWKYLIDNELPKNINMRLMRAIEWLSHSVTTTNIDHRLVDLCTVLEILLLPNRDERPKGSLIALRQTLLNRGNGLTPVSVLYLYNKRNQIVHEGMLEVTRASDYMNTYLSKITF